MFHIDRRDFIRALLGATMGSAVACLPGCRFISDHPLAETTQFRAIRINQDKCTGCRLCECVCNEFNRAVSIGGKRLPGPGEPHDALISVRSYSHPYYVAWACPGCPDIPCILSCDYYADMLLHVKALHVDKKTGEIILEKDFCAGCERCIEACTRYGAGVLRWDKNDYVTGACNLCHGDPKCVKECPTGAIKLVVVDRNARLEPRNPDKLAAIGAANLYGIDNSKWSK